MSAREDVEAIRTGFVLPSVVAKLGDRHLRMMTLITSNAPPTSYREMGEELGVSRERARQICWQIRRGRL